MTECANACRFKPKDGQEHGDPKQATHGLLCANCYRKLDDWLRDIPVDFALLELLKVSGGSQRMDGTGRTKQPEAPAPVRLDVVSLGDKPRPTVVAPPDLSNPAHERPPAGYSGVREPGDELWFELPDIVQTLATLHTWAEQLRCDLDPSRDFADLTYAHSVHGEAGYLLRALDRLVERVWVDECMAELRLVWATLTRAHGLVSGDSLGDCFTVGCAGKVYRDRFTGFPECRVCHRQYNGIDALKLRLTEEAAG